MPTSFRQTCFKLFPVNKTSLIQPKNTSAGFKTVWNLTQVGVGLTQRRSMLGAKQTKGFGGMSYFSRQIRTRIWGHVTLFKAHQNRDLWA